MNTVNAILRNEAITFGLFILAVIASGIYWAYILRRWSWIPRKQQRRGFVERF